jgi:hypothetical protein
VAGEDPAPGDAKESPISDLSSKSVHEPSYLGRAAYLDTHAPIDEEDASQYQSTTQKLSTPFINLTAQKITLDELVPRSIKQSLISSFMRKCRPWMPLVTSDEVDSLFKSDASGSFLSLAILVAGSKVSTAPNAVAIGQKCYDLAKLRFYAGLETKTFSVIIGTVFLQWWNQSGPEHVSPDNSSFWLRIGVALAHQVGLHKQPDHWDPKAPLRRKIWWSLVVSTQLLGRPGVGAHHFLKSRDCQIATSHGRPRAIQMVDSDMRPLSIRDFNATDPDALLFIEFVSVTVILGDLTQACLRQDLSVRRRADIEASLRLWLRDLPTEFHLHDRSTRSLIPYNFRSRQLHVPYFISLIILFRQKTPDQCPPGISILAASFILGIYEEYLDWGDINYVSPPSIFYLMAASLVQASSHRFPALATNKEKELHVTHDAIHSLKQRFPTALGAERVIISARNIANDVTLNGLHFELSPYEKEFLAFFGPDLCFHWDLVLRAGSPAPGMESGRSPASLPPYPRSDPVFPTGKWPIRPADYTTASAGMQMGLEQSNWDFDSIVQYNEMPSSAAIGQWWWGDLLPDV